MPRDIVLKVAAATNHPKLAVEFGSVLSAVEAVVPKLEVKALTTTDVVAVVTGEAV